jgi:hypothetical protein
MCAPSHSVASSVLNPIGRLLQSGPSDLTSESQPLTPDENVKWEHEWRTTWKGRERERVQQGWAGKVGAQYGGVDHGDMGHEIRGMAYT